MKHYGIWITIPKRKAGGAWMVDGEGRIFWTTSKAVAEAQLEMANCGRGRKMEVKEFD
jgi:hypothetical protein